MALVDGDRNIDYGDPFDDFDTTASFWQTYLSRIVARRGSLFIDAHDVAALMMLLKLSRLSWTPQKRDHWADIAGYAACGWDCVERFSYPSEEESDNSENEATMTVEDNVIAEA